MDGRSYSDDDVAALASAIYGEARNQNSIGKAAVGYSALTRANLAGVSVSDAVYGSVSKNYGQYSFANPKDKNARAVARAPTNDPEGWTDAVETAKGVLSGSIENPVPGATHYKANYAKAGWAKKAQNLGKVGGHTFYALPAAETAAVVRKAAASPYRREALVGADAISGLPQGSTGLGPGNYRGPEQIDGGKRTISIGEFNFASPRVEKGFARMTPQTKLTASEMARTLPSDQGMTVTATHGQHGLSNLTHTPGAAFDVRTRDLNKGQLDNLVDSALYSRPASIGYNSGAGRFPAHMHVDTNAGYGLGLQSHSDFAGLSDYAKQELQRYDQEMKSGLGYTPPVPESIAPVPSPRPVMEVARNPYDLTPKAPEATLSAGLADFPGAAGASTTPDGVPINRVRSISITPDMMKNGPAALGTMVASANPAAQAGTLGAAQGSVSLAPSISAVGNASIAPGPSAAATATIGPASFAEADIAKGPRLGLPDPATFDTAAIAKGPRLNVQDPATFPSVDIAKGPRLPGLGPTTPPSIGGLPTEIARNPFDLAKAPVAPPEMIGPVRPQTISAIDPPTIGPSLPSTFTPQTPPSIQPMTAPTISPMAEPTPTSLPALDAPRTISSLPRVATAAPQTPDVSAMTSRAAQPKATASDVWGGKAATGVATDGSTLTRNADGSVSRTSAKTGKTSTIAKAVEGWDGPSIGSAPGGFWSGSLPKADVGYQGGRQVRSLGDTLSDMFGGLADRVTEVFSPNKNEFRGGLSSYGDRVRSESKQFDRAVSSGKGGLW